MRKITNSIIAKVFRDFADKIEMELVKLIVKILLT